MSDIDPKSLDPKFREELRKHAWEYFKLHAEQRTRVFNFYVLLTVAMVAGLLTVLKEVPAVPYAASAICVMIVFFSFIFLQLDTRARSLVANAERALVVLEEDERLPDGADGSRTPGGCSLARRTSASVRPRTTSSGLTRIASGPCSS